MTTPDPALELTDEVDAALRDGRPVVALESTIISHGMPYPQNVHMATEVERYIIELGTEGRLIEMQLEETVVGVMADRAALVRDYSTVDSEQEYERQLSELAKLPHTELLDFGRLAELLGYDRKLNTLDFPVAPRGYRVLGRIPRIPKLVVQKIIHEFGGFEEVLAASDADLEAVDDVGQTRAKDIREGLQRLREVEPVDRYLQS